MKEVLVIRESDKRMRIERGGEPVTRWKLDVFELLEDVRKRDARLTQPRNPVI